MEITRSNLRKRFTYRDNGELYYRIHHYKHFPGDQFGRVQVNGHKTGSINGKMQMVSQLIWLYHYGWKVKRLVFLDGDKTNTKIQNLEELTPRPKRSSPAH